MPATALRKSPASSNGYASLLASVKKTLIEGQSRIEQERVKTYWETGRLIYADILKHKGRAEYGGEVIARLAKDIGVNGTLLHRCVRFAEKYPRLPIVAARQQFSWTHYRQLITVSDEKKRVKLERQAIAHEWSTDELAARIKESSSAAGRPSPESGHGSRVTSDKLLIPSKGRLYTYQLTKRPNISAQAEPDLLVDLGFSMFHKVDEKLLTQFSAGDIVESVPKEDAYRFIKIERTPKDLYTYAAYVERVIDGDTLKVRVDLGFDTWSRQVLRLRGIDAPEIATKEGEAAKAFVQSHIKEADRIIIRSSKSDKYDRYLADAWISQGEEAAPAKDIYINNLLLENGHAVRMM